MKPGLAAAIAVAFVALIAGVVFVGPELVDAVAGAPQAPPPEPIARPAEVAVDAGAVDAGTVHAEPPPVHAEPVEAVSVPELQKPKAEPVGYLTLTTVPPGIMVRHKGAELGKTPLKKTALPVGKQALALEFKGQRKLMAVTVRAGKEQKINLPWARMK